MKLSSSFLVTFFFQVQCLLILIPFLRRAPCLSRLKLSVRAFFKKRVRW